MSHRDGSTPSRLIAAQDNRKRPRAFADLGLNIPIYERGEVRASCPPQCPLLHKRRARDIAVNVDKGTGLCHRCGWRFSLHRGTSVLPPQPISSTYPNAAPQQPSSCANAQTLDMCYRAFLRSLRLSARHRTNLRQRGLSDPEILQRGYRSLPLRGRARIATRLADQFGPEVCATVPGLIQAERDGDRWWSLAGPPGTLIPVKDQQGLIIALKIRVDHPTGRGKYVSFSSTSHHGPSSGSHLHIPDHATVGNTIRITEGELKADVATVLSDVLTLGVPGVGQWRLALPALENLRPRTVLIAWDSDWKKNPRVAETLYELVTNTPQNGYEVLVEVWQPSQGKGVDDILVAGYSPRRIPLRIAVIEISQSLLTKVIKL